MRAGASKMGFFEHEDGDEESGEDDDKGDDEDDDKPPLIDHFEPGTFWDLPPNTKFTAFDPQFPNQAHEPFARYELRRAATGFDVNYHSLTGDLENVNLSTIRFGIQDERTVWKSLQETLIETFERPNFIDWLRNSIAAGAVPVHPRNLELFNEPKFQGVRWPYMDPVKDVQSERLAIDGGLDTITDSLAEQGKDIRELFQTRKEELDLAKKLELPIESLSKFNAAGTFAQDEQQLQADQNAASSSSKKKTGK
jgi:lambda family phage portal protein